MMVKINQKRENPEQLVYLNSGIKICIFCGYDKIESHEHGVSCEQCGTSFGRAKC